MTPLTASAFDLPDHLTAKAGPRLIAGDEQHFAAIAQSLEQSITDLSDRLDAARKAPGGIGQQALDRDLEIHRLTARLRLEFDLVVLIDPETWGAAAFGTEAFGAELSGGGAFDGATSGIEGVVDRYVAMTRATQRLVLLTSS